MDSWDCFYCNTGEKLQILSVSADRRLQVSREFLISHSKTSCSRLHYQLLLQIFVLCGIPGTLVWDVVGLTSAPCLQLSLSPAWMKARSWMFLNETQLTCLPSARLHQVSAAHWLHRQGGPLTNNNIHVVPKFQASSQLDKFSNLLHHMAKWHLCQNKAKGRAEGGREAELYSWFCF